MNKTVTLIVNGVSKSVTTDTERLLLDVLREDFQLTGTKFGCGEGKCGCCTVLVDGKDVRSCQENAVDFDGKPITTIEGLAQGDVLHPVQEAFIAERAMQCGYCVPGMVLTTVALLKKYPKPTDRQIQNYMTNNLCRCNNYVNITRAIHRAAESVK
jgi:aerobic-type carbon monoxide dehydrogenase small subunit (CoxS/CutS family)